MYMKRLASRTIKYSKFIPSFLLIALLFSTNPSKGTFLIFIVFFLIGIVFYQLLQIVMQKITKRTSSRTSRIVLVTMLLLLVALQSLGQLNLIDATIIVILSMTLAFYLGRFNIQSS
jgi:hypothetical protein